MAVLTQVAADTSYVLLLGGLFVMGMGMGMTMMPIMSAALASLTDHQIARGSTMMNIIQQTAGSIGTAVMSVVLTNEVKNDIGSTDPTGDLAGVFSSVFWVGTVMVAVVLVPAFFLPRRKAEQPVDPKLLVGH